MSRYYILIRQKGEGEWSIVHNDSRTPYRTHTKSDALIRVFTMPESFHEAFVASLRQIKRLYKDDLSEVSRLTFEKEWRKYKDK